MYTYIHIYVYICRCVKIYMCIYMYVNIYTPVWIGLAYRILQGLSIFLDGVGVRRHADDHGIL